MKEKLKYILIISVLLGGCHSDLHTKKMATESLKGEAPEVIISGFLDLEYTENQGGAFSVFGRLAPEIRRPLLLSTSLLLGLFLAALILVNRHRSLWLLLPYLLILSGAVGNLIDRVRHGYVVDFIHFHIRDDFHWAVFNVADILITVGIGVVFLQALLSRSTLDIFLTRPSPP